jgi:diguanylate cyclase (GGDEF)-like protein
MLQSEKQALRLRRALLSNLGLLLGVLLCMLATYLGYASVSQSITFIYAMTMWVGHLMIVGLIFFNWSLRFKDPSLTLLQMVWCITGFSGLMFILNDFRVSLLMAYLLLIAFGTFRLSLQGFLGIITYTLACYVAVLFSIQYFEYQEINIGQEIFYLSGFILVLGGFVFIGVETGGLRKKLAMGHRQLIRANARIENLVVTDNVTGLFNQRNLIKILTQQRALSNRSQYGFVVCYLDLDHFKQVHDQYGQPFSDKVLKTFSELITDNLREIDVGARMDGDEFALILVDTQIEAAKKVYERMAQNWIKQTFEQAPGLSLTFSGGMTEFKSPETVDQVLTRAAALLNQAKNKGANSLLADQ